MNRKEVGTIFLILGAVILFMSILAIAEAQEIGYDIHVEGGVAMQEYHCVDVRVYDNSRGIGFANYNALKDIPVNVDWQHNSKSIIDSKNGTTARNGWFSACDFVTIHQYSGSQYYIVNVTIGDHWETYGWRTIERDGTGPAR